MLLGERLGYRCACHGSESTIRDLFFDPKDTTNFWELGAVGDVVIARGEAQSLDSGDTRDLHGRVICTPPLAIMSDIAAIRRQLKIKSGSAKRFVENSKRIFARDSECYAGYTKSINCTRKK